MNQVRKIHENSALKPPQYFSALNTLHIVNEPREKNTGFFGPKSHAIFFGFHDPSINQVRKSSHNENSSPQKFRL
jgi:hypothetical protein